MSEGRAYTGQRAPCSRVVWFFALFRFISVLSQAGSQNYDGEESIDGYHKRKVRKNHTKSVRIFFLRAHAMRDESVCLENRRDHSPPLQTFHLEILTDACVALSVALGSSSCF